MGPTSFSNLIATAKPGAKLELKVQELTPVTLTPTLGARTAEYLEPPDREEARARFIRWWQEQGGDLWLQQAPSPSSILVTQSPAPGSWAPTPESCIIP
jgi:hypothetical protein